MNTKTADTIKTTASFIIGALLLFTSLFTYRRHPAEIYELTFLSNFLVGIFFTVNGIVRCRGRRIPPILHLCSAILRLIVFGVCIAFTGQFQFGGGFIFLHIVNPLVVLLYYLILCDLSDTKIKYVLTVVVVPLLYFGFMLLFGAITGNYIYFFMDYKKFGIGYSAVFILGILMGIFIVSFALYSINRLLHKAVKKRAQDKNNAS